MSEEKPKSKTRGFAGMPLEKRREVAARGGGAVPGHKRSFATNRELASTAGAKGGAASRGGGRGSKPKPY